MIPRYIIYLFVKKRELNIHVIAILMSTDVRLNARFFQSGKPLLYESLRK